MVVTSSQFIAAMRHFPAAVNVVTASDGGVRAGFTATAVMSLTAEPPQVVVAVNKDVSGLPNLLSAGHFCVSTLSSHHAEIASRFAGKVKGTERFMTGEWTTLTTGSPALADAVVNLDCRIIQTIEFSSHHLVVGQVEAIRKNDDQKPLLYMDGNWASLLPGSDYGFNGYLEAVRKTVDVVGVAERENAKPRDRMKQIVHELTLYYIRRQDVTRDQLVAETYVSSDQLNDINELRKAFDSQISALLDQGSAEGEFEVEDIQLASFAISGMVTWVHRWYRPNGRLTPEEIGAKTARLIDRMISPRQPEKIP